MPRRVKASHAKNINERPVFLNKTGSFYCIGVFFYENVQNFSFLFRDFALK